MSIVGFRSMDISSLGIFGSSVGESVYSVPNVGQSQAPLTSCSTVWSSPSPGPSHKSVPTWMSTTGIPVWFRGSLQSPLTGILWTRTLTTARHLPRISAIFTHRTLRSVCKEGPSVALTHSDFSGISPHSLPWARHTSRWVSTWHPGVWPLPPILSDWLVPIAKYTLQACLKLRRCLPQWILHWTWGRK